MNATEKRPMELTTNGYLIPITDAEAASLDYDRDEEGGLKSGTVDVGGPSAEKLIAGYRLRGQLRGRADSWLCVRRDDGLYLLEADRDLALGLHQAQ